MYTLDLGNPILGSILEERLPMTQGVTSDILWCTRALGPIHKSESTPSSFSSWYSVLMGKWKHVAVKIFD